MQDYQDAARALQQVISGASGMKSAVFGCGARNVKRAYALVCETSRNINVLRRIIRTVPAVSARLGHGEPALLLILTYELLLGRGNICGGGQLKRVLMEYEADLRSAAAKLGVVKRAAKEAGTRGGSGSAAAATLPRYVRVNTLQCSVEDAITRLTDANGSGTALTTGDVRRDVDVPDLLALPADAHSRLDLHAHPLVTSGCLVLQDKASCFPAWALLRDVVSPSLSSSATLSAARGDGGDSPAADGGGALLPLTQPFDALDACAAPGNKTSHLAALLARLDGNRSLVPPEMSDEAPTDATHTSRSVGGGSRKRRRDAQNSAAGAAACSAVASDAKHVSRVFAFDRDHERAALLERRMAEAGASGGAAPRVVVTCADFCAAAPVDDRLSRVAVALVDPSCSGSGMALHGSFALSAAAEKTDATTAISADALPPPRVPSGARARVAALTTFQRRALLTALALPSVVRVVYSTCSLYAEEDEMLVADVLREFNAAAAAAAAEIGGASQSHPGVRLIAAVPSWHRRGAIGYGLTAAEASLCARCDPRLGDASGGFFVALLHKTEHPCMAPSPTETTLQRPPEVLSVVQPPKSRDTSDGQHVAKERLPARTSKAMATNVMITPTAVPLSATVGTVDAVNDGSSSNNPTWQLRADRKKRPQKRRKHRKVGSY